MDWAKPTARRDDEKQLNFGLGVAYITCLTIVTSKMMTEATDYPPPPPPPPPPSKVENVFGALMSSLLLE